MLMRVCCAGGNKTRQLEKRNAKEEEEEEKSCLNITCVLCCCCCVLRRCVWLTFYSFVDFCQFFSLLSLLTEKVHTQQSLLSSICLEGSLFLFVLFLIVFLKDIQKTLRGSMLYSPFQYICCFFDWICAWGIFKKYPHIIERPMRWEGGWLHFGLALKTKGGK